MLAFVDGENWTISGFLRKSERLLFYTQETLVVKSRIVSCYIIYVKLVQI